MVQAQQGKPLPRFSAAELRSDFLFLKDKLEKAHPGLFTYTSPQELDKYFTWAYNSIKDSMNELQFRNVLSYAISKIRCGHTAVRPSRAFTRYQQRDRSPHFPMNVRVWNDSMVVTSSWLKPDSGLARGTFITSVNGKSVPELLGTLYEFMSLDGYSNGVNEIRLSYSFPFIFRNIYGIAERYTVGYIDGNGMPEEKSIPSFKPRSREDSAKGKIKKIDKVEKSVARKSRKKAKRTLLENARSFRIDSASRAGILEINTFTNGYRLPSFYKKTFRSLKANNIKNLVVDIRDNGGGNLRNYILLTRYLRKTPFKVADSVIAVTHKMPSHRYVEAAFLNDLYMMLTSWKKRDGYYHFTFFERHRYKPRQKNHYNGDVYVITSGQTFSAATLFTSAMKGQPDCTVVGEETGGGAYGNNGMLIPNLTLPNSRVRVTLPLFRIVIDKNRENNGRGILPDVEVRPSAEAIRRGEDSKMNKVMELIAR